MSLNNLVYSLDCMKDFTKKYKELEKSYGKCLEEVLSIKKILDEALAEEDFSKYDNFLKKYNEITKKEVCKNFANDNNRAKIWNLVRILVANNENKEKFFRNILIPLKKIYDNKKSEKDIVDFILNVGVYELKRIKEAKAQTLIYNLSYLLPDIFPFADEFMCKALNFKNCHSYNLNSYFLGEKNSTLDYKTVREFASLVEERNMFKFSSLFRTYLKIYCSSNSSGLKKNSKVTKTIAKEKHLEKIDNICVEEIEKYLKNKQKSETLFQLLLKNKQIILYGPVGTGKTFVANLMAKCISNNPKEDIKIVTFHPSYEYEDFVEGLFPEAKDGDISYYVRNGIFKRMALQATIAALKKVCNGESMGPESLKELCENPCFKRIGASELKEFLKQIEKKGKCIDMIMDCEKWRGFKDRDSLPKFILVIDEINRADLSRVFGELITLLEKDKRLGRENCITVTLPYSREKFGVPPNLYIIGTMNTTDRSIALIDLALRRRFAFKEIEPDPSLLEEIVVKNINIGELLKKLNERIKKEKGRDYQIGHAFFIKLNDKNLSDEEKERILLYIWNNQVAPLLEEIFYGREDELKEIFGENLYDETERRIERIDDVEKLKALVQTQQ